MADAPPDFSRPTYEEASQHWPVQTRGQAGYSAPQDPSTLPRGKAASEAHGKRAAPGGTSLPVDGRESVEAQGRLEAAAAPQVKASGRTDLQRRIRR